MSAHEAATQHYEDELARYASPRDWWRIATLSGGEPVGFVLPARNDYGPIIAYLGVLPAHRGNGYVDEILGEGTRVLARAGRPADPGVHRPRQRADGTGVRARRIRRVRASDRHDVEPDLIADTAPAADGT